MTDGTAYDDKFFSNFSESNIAASTAFSILSGYVPVNSVVDIGCGNGSWLNVVVNNGCGDIVGIDGDYVDLNRLLFPKDKFTPYDLENPIRLGRRFDVAVCCEVAEHLTPERASSFINDICALSDHVIFSAAAPLQGGTHHINEQWPEYWAVHFRRNGFIPVDMFRPALRKQSSAQWYFRQGLFLYVRKEVSGKICADHPSLEKTVMTQIDPEFLMHIAAKHFPFIHTSRYDLEVEAFRRNMNEWCWEDVAEPTSINQQYLQTISLLDNERAKFAPPEGHVNHRAYWLQEPFSLQTEFRSKKRAERADRLSSAGIRELMLYLLSRIRSRLAK